MATTAKNTKTAKTKNVAASASRASREIAIPENYEPISMWGYFGYEFLFAIPVIGWVLCISFALMAHNHNLRNFARSQFCFLIIYLVIFCVLAGIGVLGAMVQAIGLA